MFSITIFLLLSSGGVFASAFFKKRFEEILPVTCMGIVAVLFLFGMLNALNTGLYAVLVLLVLLWAISIIHIILHKDFFESIRCFFTPAFFAFAFIFFLICFFNKGRVASTWDEFSHWVDSVKVMFTIGDFVTNKNSFSLFKSYPPGMALFQYFFTKVNAIVSRNTVFVEEKVYVAYQVFCVSVLTPFFAGYRFKKAGHIIAAVTTIICSTLLFYPNILNVAVIDPFVSVLGAFGFAVLVINEKIKPVHCAQISLVCFVLVLAKDIGLYFSCFICICYIIRVMTNLNSSVSLKKRLIKAGILCAFPVLATAIAKILWKIEIAVSAVHISGGKTGLLPYTKMFFTRCDNTYRQDVVESFKDAFFEKRVAIGDFEISVSYFNLTVLFVALIFVIYYLYSKKTASKKHKTALKIICLTVIVQFVFYIYSLGAIYVSNFSEYEATRLMSYNRYMDIVFRMIYITVFVVFIDYFSKIKINTGAVAVIAAVAIILAPFSNVVKFVNKSYVKDSITVRGKYTEITEDINSNCKPTSKIFFISQEDKGFDYHVTRFSVRPFVIDNSWAWSLSGEGPFYEGDIWTKKMSAEELKDTLIKDNYGYVAMFKTNDYFNENYGVLFENPDDIVNNSVFEFDGQTQKLKRVDITN